MTCYSTFPSPLVGHACQTTAMFEWAVSNGLNMNHPSLPRALGRAGNVDTVRMARLLQFPLTKAVWSNATDPDLITYLIEEKCPGADDQPIQPARPSPFQTLPREIIFHILSLALGSRAHSYPVLRTVCKAWNEITGHLVRSITPPYAPKFRFVPYVFTSLSLFEWAVRNKLLCMKRDQQWFVPEVASHGSIDVMRTVRLMGFNITEYTARHAARYRNVDVVNYLLHANVPVDARALLFGAVASRSLDMVKLCVNHTTTRYSDLCAAAVTHGFDILKLLHSRGFKLDRHVAYNATQKGRLDILKWAINHKAPIHNDVLEYAIHPKHRHIITHLLSIGYTWTVDCMMCAVPTNDIEYIQWLRQHGCPWGHITLSHARDFGANDELVAWLNTQDCPP